MCTPLQCATFPFVFRSYVVCHVEHNSNQCYFEEIVSRRFTSSSEVIITSSIPEDRWQQYQSFHSHSRSLLPYPTTTERSHQRWMRAKNMDVNLIKTDKYFDWKINPLWRRWVEQINKICPILSSSSSRFSVFNFHSLNWKWKMEKWQIGSALSVRDKGIY